MKRFNKIRYFVLTLLTASIFFQTVIAQSNYQINYQGVARDNLGTVLNSFNSVVSKMNGGLLSAA